MPGSQIDLEYLRPPGPFRKGERERYISSSISPERRILSWLNACDKEHGHHCKSTIGQQYMSNVPFWLIDVIAGCVTKACGQKYLALSYTWEISNTRGSRGMLRKENLELLQRPRAFEAEDGIPLAVRDAMKLTAKLGQKYLWVDRFCIVQDDDVTKDYQIRHMPLVYANAYLTIVAAAGDASSPLQGVPGLNARKRPRLQSHIDVLNESRWITRAWTLQELLFSRRAVFFVQDHMAWECHCDVWEEVKEPTPLGEIRSREECTNRFTGASTGLQQSPWPDMDEYSRIVEDYSGRSLTHEEDTFPAFLGVTNALSESFIGGFVYGMPDLFFDIALLWRPKERIERKVAPNQGTILPSWSWMGWCFGVAKVDLVLWRAASSYVQSSDRCKRGVKRHRSQSPFSTSVQPTIEWSLGLPGRQHGIKSDGLRYRNVQNDSNADIPIGWSKSSGRFVHKYDEHTLFNYPVPVQERESAYLTLACDYTSFAPLLHFKTMHGHFNIKFYCRKNPHKPRDNDIAIANILDNNGAWAGHFRSHDMKLGLDSENHDGHEKLEFIAISTGSERYGSHVFDMQYFVQHWDADKKVEFVNVLWIERIDGIAYRRGLGHVVKSAWERQATEMVDVVLG